MHLFIEENKNTEFVEFINQNGDYRSISIRNENLKDLVIEKQNDIIDNK